MATTFSRRWMLLLAFALFVAEQIPGQGPLFAESHRMLPWDNQGSYAVAAADVDGDGDPDLVFGGPAGQDRLYLNDGTAVFTDASANLPPGPTGTSALAAADVDGDGDVDLLLAQYPPRLYLNNGSGVFVYAPGQLPANAIQCLAMGDVTGDGHPDVFAGAALGQPVFLYVNNGQGIFVDVSATHLPLAGLSGDTRAIDLGDVDGDGDLDAFIGNAGFGQNHLFVNTGQGVFVNGTAQLPAIGDATTAVKLVDLDGDLDLDAVVGNDNLLPFLPGSYLLVNSGAGAFLGPFFLPSPPSQVRAIAALDVDLDSDVDLLLAGLNGSTIYLNSNGSAMAVPLQTSGASANAISATDLDGDLDPDVVLANGGFSQLFLNDGLGNLTDTEPSLSLGASSAFPRITTGDIDGDGDRDLLAWSGGALPDRLFRNDGSATFIDATAQLLPPGSCASLDAVLRDLDGDGDLDCLSSCLLLNNGSGVLANASGQLPAGYSASSLAVADVDGDADPDAFTGSQIMINNGTAVFSYAPTPLPPVLSGLSRGAFADVDGDSDQDLFVVNGASCYMGYCPLPDQLFLNNGAGVFIDATSGLPAGPGGGVSIVFGDVDGDSDLDALIGRGATGVSSPSLFLNNGVGIFTDASSQLPATVASAAVALRDVDLDGDLDAVLGDLSFVLPARLWLNDGAGVFTDASGLVPPRLAYDLALEDLDGDGDVDILTVDSRCHVLSNQIRHLSWRGPPRVGKPIVLDIAGPPGGAYCLAADGATTSVPFPPFGVLRLDLATAVLVGCGSLDPQGRAAPAFQTPPGWLIGVTIYAQVGVSSPLRLTNLEVFPISGL